MTKKNAPGTATEALKALHEFLIGPEPDFQSMPAEEVHKFLNEAGVDPKPAIRIIQRRIAETRGRYELAKARAKRQQTERRLAMRGSRERICGSFAEVLQRIEQLVGSQQVAVYARRYKSRNEEDLASLIEDLEDLQTLQEDDADK